MQNIRPLKEISFYSTPSLDRKHASFAEKEVLNMFIQDFLDKTLKSRIDTIKNIKKFKKNMKPTFDLMAFMLYNADVLINLNQVLMEKYNLNSRRKNQKITSYNLFELFLRYYYYDVAQLINTNAGNDSEIYLPKSIWSMYFAFNIVFKILYKVESNYISEYTRVRLAKGDKHSYYLPWDYDKNPEAISKFNKIYKNLNVLKSDIEEDLLESDKYINRISLILNNLYNLIMIYVPKQGMLDEGF